MASRAGQNGLLKCWHFVSLMLTKDLPNSDKDLPSTDKNQLYTNIFVSLWLINNQLNTDIFVSLWLTNDQLNTNIFVSSVLTNDQLDTNRWSTLLWHFCQLGADRSAQIGDILPTPSIHKISPQILNSNFGQILFWPDL